jgi:hypothetical protein
MAENKKYSCIFCNYFTNFPSDWIKHTNSAKHQRQGKNKTHVCELCEYEAKSKWNMKLHNLAIHTPKEDREKMKYYCEVCDKVFFSKLYKDNHMKGIKHSNVIKALELVGQMNNLGK